MRHINTALLIALLFLVAGCGSDSNSSDTNDTNSTSAFIVDNSLQPKNDLGYYGNGVMLGTEKIVGGWEDDIRTLSFVDDGSVEIFGIDLSYGGTTHYGVNQDGTEVTFKNNNNTYTCTSFEAGCCYMDENNTNNIGHLKYMCKDRAEYVR